MQQHNVWEPVNLQDGEFDVMLIIADEAVDKALAWALASSLKLPPGATGSAVALPMSAAARCAEMKNITSKVLKFGKSLGGM